MAHRQALSLAVHWGTCCYVSRTWLSCRSAATLSCTMHKIAQLHGYGVAVQGIQAHVPAMPLLACRLKRQQDIEVRKKKPSAPSKRQRGTPQRREALTKLCCSRMHLSVAADEKRTSPTQNKIGHHGKLRGAQQTPQVSHRSAAASLRWAKPI